MPDQRRSPSAEWTLCGFPIFKEQACERPRWKIFAQEVTHLKAHQQNWVELLFGLWLEDGWCRVSGWRGVLLHVDLSVCTPYNVFWFSAEFIWLPVFRWELWNKIQSWDYVNSVSLLQPIKAFTCSSEQTSESIFTVTDTDTNQI